MAMIDRHKSGTYRRLDAPAAGIIAPWRPRQTLTNSKSTGFLPTGGLAGGINAFATLIREKVDVSRLRRIGAAGGHQ
jgi:hypothetical protein